MGPVLEVAPRLLSARVSLGGVTCRITEVEAYDGSNDPGSHAYRGPTRRNATMFGPPGCLYVYFTYGMHHCCNVVCGPAGGAAAVLLRAGEVVTGVEQARKRRPAARADRELANGPAKLCQALGIDGSADGADLLGPGAMVRLRVPAAPPSAGIHTGPRVGLRRAADRPWRFWLDGEATVSRYVPAPPAR